MVLELRVLGLGFPGRDLSALGGLRCGHLGFQGLPGLWAIRSSPTNRDPWGGGEGGGGGWGREVGGGG